MKAVTRRNLFQAATVVPAAAVRGTAANSMPSVGLIGCGGRGTFLAQLLVEHTQARLAAICDLYPEQIAKTQKGIGRSSMAVYSDMEKLLASNVDALLIATPVFLHPEHFEKAVQAKKHIYLEKPAAPDVEGCKRIERASASANKDRELCFGFQRRQGEVYRKAHALAQSGKLGQFRMVSVRFIKADSDNKRKPIPVPKTFDEKVKTWGFWRELSGDLIVENNVHVLDVMNWFLGALPVEACGAGGRTTIQAGDNRDHGTVSYQYPGGVQGDLCGMTLAPAFHRDVREEFFGTQGYLEVSERGWKYAMSRTEAHEEKSPRNIAIDSVKNFVTRVAEGKTENTIQRGVDSTLTAILGRLAMDRKKAVSWKEMVASNGW